MNAPTPQRTGSEENGCTPGKRERNRVERRAAIVAVAQRLFLEQGYAATTMSAVAEALGGSKATLWAHFSSKEALFAGVADSMVGGFAESMDELLGGQRFSIRGLREFCLRFFEKLLSAESTTLFRMIIAESGRFPELGELFFARGPEQTAARLERYFAGAFGPDEARRLAKVTLSALVGFRVQAMMQPSQAHPHALEAFADDLIESLRVG
ncbi:TetR/AcrR family transcriptional regulator [Novosphingobium sp.]|uniref:TetR/AcrR family transcriptional regulator n=1 Tax=Novosphingobium sp. TaxID=1874826 RepID=UPI0025D85277|nr:TetR/AcrR family transcriptional regulator [Novosphingobium sp.]